MTRNNRTKEEYSLDNKGHIQKGIEGNASLFPFMQ